MATSVPRQDGAATSKSHARSPSRLPPGGRPPSNKTMRHFYCLDALWELFDQLAAEFGCTIDYLLNEAMRAYVRSKGRVPGPPPLTRRPQPHQRTPPPPVPVEAEPVARSLFLIFKGQQIPITKEQFVIGRVTASSDLVIKDGNISRKHAAVIRRNGVHYIKDLGSTNGIDYRGARIDSKRIEDGDVFNICDYQLTFTYR